MHPVNTKRNTATYMMSIAWYRCIFAISNYFGEKKSGGVKKKFKKTFEVVIVQTKVALSIFRALYYSIQCIENLHILE